MEERFTTAARSFLRITRLLEPSRRLRREIHNFRQNRLTETDIAEIYRADYHERAGYGREEAVEGGWESDEVIKREHASAILTLLPVKRVLVGGCSRGMAVREFRRQGVEAFGFDISPDLEKIVIDEVRPFIRRGSMTAIPFGNEDGFDLLVTTDVLEHVQLRSIETMMKEIARVSPPFMAHLINHHAMTVDHMTLKPLTWWEKRFREHGYVLRHDMRAPVHANPRIYGLSGRAENRYTFWERYRG